MNNVRYEVIERMSWRNNKTGETASIYGAHPSVSREDDKNWTVVHEGYTIRDNVENRIGGFQSVPKGSSKEHAESVAKHFNAEYNARMERFKAAQHV